jgi:hypothetical protein
VSDPKAGDWWTRWDDDGSLVVAKIISSDGCGTAQGVAHVPAAAIPALRAALLEGAAQVEVEDDYDVEHDVGVAMYPLNVPFLAAGKYAVVPLEGESDG